MLHRSYNATIHAIGAYCDQYKTNAVILGVVKNVSDAINKNQLHVKLTSFVLLIHSVVQVYNTLMRPFVLDEKETLQKVQTALVEPLPLTQFLKYYNFISQT